MIKKEQSSYFFRVFHFLTMSDVLIDESIVLTSQDYEAE